MRIGEIIKQYRIEHKLSMERFAVLAGKSKGYISMLEKGENPQTKKPISPALETLQNLATAMHMDFEELVALLDDNQLIATKTAHNSTIEPVSDKVSYLDRELKEPRHSEWISHGESLLKEQTAASTTSDKVIDLYDARKRVSLSVPGKVSAGTGYWQEDDYDTMVDFYADDIPDEKDYDTVAVVVGHSMEPKIKNGDFLFIKTTSDIPNGAISIWQVNGENYVKKFRTNGKPYLESLNKDYQDVALNEDDNIRPLGIVVNIYRD